MIKQPDSASPDVQRMVCGAAVLLMIVSQACGPEAPPADGAEGGHAGAPSDDGTMAGGRSASGGRPSSDGTSSGGMPSGGGGGGGGGSGFPDGGTSGGDGGESGDGGTEGQTGGAGGTPSDSGGSPGSGGEEASGGTASGGTEGSGGAPDPGPVNDCVTFIDRTDEQASRTIPWGFGISGATERCMRVLLGQSVTFEGTFSTHPLGGVGGDQPSPISGNYPSGALEYTVEFNALGTFGYECLTHSTMRGAIHVIP